MQKSQVIIVNGDGGTGKNHLLTKMSNDLIYKDMFLLLFFMVKLFINLKNI